MGRIQSLADCHDRLRLVKQVQQFLIGFSILYHEFCSPIHRQDFWPPRLFEALDAALSLTLEMRERVNIFNFEHTGSM